MSYGEKVAQDMEANKEHIAGSSDWFKFKEGMNVIRVLVEPAPLFEDFKMGICYHDCGFQGSPKFLTHVFDRADGKVKLMKIPNTINDEIIALEKSSRFKFDGFPMPYDLEINAKNAGTKEVKYSVLPGEEVGIAGETLERVSKEKRPAEIIEAFKKKNLEKHEADGTRAKIIKARAELKSSIDAAVAHDGAGYPQEDSEGMANWDGPEVN